MADDEDAAKKQEEFQKRKQEFFAREKARLKEEVGLGQGRMPRRGAIRVDRRREIAKSVCASESGQTFRLPGRYKQY